MNRALVIATDESRLSADDPTADATVRLMRALATTSFSSAACVNQPSSDDLRRTLEEFFQSLGDDDSFLVCIMGKCEQLASGALALRCQDTSTKCTLANSFELDDLRRLIGASARPGIIITDLEKPGGDVPSRTSPALHPGFEDKGIVAISRWHQRGKKVRGASLFVATADILDASQDCRAIDLTPENLVVQICAHYQKADVPRMFWPMLWCSGDISDLVLLPAVASHEVVPHLSASPTTSTRVRDDLAKYGALVEVKNNTAACRRLEHLAHVSAETLQSAKFPAAQRLAQYARIGPGGQPVLLLPVNRITALRAYIGGLGAIAGAAASVAVAALNLRYPHATTAVVDLATFVSVSSLAGLLIFFHQGRHRHESRSLIVSSDGVVASLRAGQVQLAWRPEHEVLTTNLIASETHVKVGRRQQLTISNLEGFGRRDDDVAAALQWGIAARDRLTIPEDAAPANAAVRFASMDHSCWIAVGSHQHKDIVDLPGAEQDIASIRGCVDVEARGQALKNATLAQMLRTLEATFAKAKAQTAVVYFSGHGTDKAGEFYFILQDTDPNRLFATALPFGKICELASESGVAHLVVILDACTSGSAGVTPDDALTQALQPRTAVALNVTILAAVGPRLPAIATGRGSLFTRSLATSVAEVLKRQRHVDLDLLWHTCHAAMERAGWGQVCRKYVHGPVYERIVIVEKASWISDLSSIITRSRERRTLLELTALRRLVSAESTGYSGVLAGPPGLKAARFWLIVGSAVFIVTALTGIAYIACMADAISLSAGLLLLLPPVAAAYLALDRIRSTPRAIWITSTGFAMSYAGRKIFLPASQVAGFRTSRGIVDVPGGVPGQVNSRIVDEVTVIDDQGADAIVVNSEQAWGREYGSLHDRVIAGARACMEERRNDAVAELDNALRTLERRSN